MSNAAGKPKPAFFIILALVIAGLVGMAAWRYLSKGKADGPGGNPDQKVDLDKLKEQAGAPIQAEDPNNADGVTTAKEYQFESGAKLPEVPGSSDYKPMKDRTVRFAINVWAGWAPIVYANEGFKPKKVWKDAKGKDFKLELVLIDNPIDMRNTFAAGEVHIGWATVDMLPLLIEGLKKDPRTMPRVFQQVDWSNGGDGIVVRDTIKSIADLRGKKVVLAQNSPSHFFLLNALLNGGVQPDEVEMVFTKDAFQAARAFVVQKDIAACVSWAPDIYRIAEKVKGNKLLVTTGTANKLIADVWFARADFARDNMDIVEGITRGIFDAMVTLKDDPAKQQVAKWLGDGYGLPPEETLGMLGDAHWTNFAENRDFFLNQNNPTNFERTYNTAFLLYKAIGSVSQKVDFDQLVDFSIIKKLATDEKYASQKNEYQVQFAPVAANAIAAESEILTKTVVISFFPNSHELKKKVQKKDASGKDVEVLYDPNVDFVVEEIAKLAGQYGAARIVIEGHTDGSMKGAVDGGLVKDLSLNRANAVKQELVQKFKLTPNQFTVNGLGWDRPADPNDPNNHAKNRRVEVKVYPAEAQ
jgi:NitT/TauT family transport system substrate-binding protein